MIKILLFVCFISILEINESCMKIDFLFRMVNYRGFGGLWGVC